MQTGSIKINVTVNSTCCDLIVSFQRIFVLVIKTYISSLIWIIIMIVVQDIRMWRKH